MSKMKNAFINISAAIFIRAEIVMSAIVKALVSTTFAFLQSSAFNETVAIRKLWSKVDKNFGDFTRLAALFFFYFMAHFNLLLSDQI